MKIFNRLAFSSLALAASGSASAGMVHNPISVPADSPWALGALGVIVAVVVARIIRKR